MRDYPHPPWAHAAQDPSTYIIFLGASPEVGPSSIAGNVQDSNPLEAGEWDRSPITLRSRNAGKRKKERGTASTWSFFTSNPISPPPRAAEATATAELSLRDQKGRGSPHPAGRRANSRPEGPLTACNCRRALPAHLQQDLLLQVLVGSVQQLFGSENSVPHHVLGPTPAGGKQRTDRISALFMQ